MSATGFVTAFVLGLCILGVGFAFTDPLLYIMGSTETILPYARDYMRIILLGAPYMTASLVLNNQLRFQGSAFYSMIGITFGAVLNVGLDPLFIFVFDMGVAGAAWATILSQFVSFCLLIAGTFRGGNLKLNLRNFSPSLKYYKNIVKGGTPSLCRQGLGSFATICLNLMAGPYGDAAIAAMSIVTRITQFANSIVIGFGQGFQPVCGFNYGAKLYARVREGFWFCVKLATCILLAAAYLFGTLMAGVLQALCDAEEMETLAYYLDCWRGVFAASSTAQAVGLFGAELAVVLGAAAVFLLLGLSAVGPLPIFLFAMLYGTGSGLLSAQLLNSLGAKQLVLFLLTASLPTALAAGALCLFGASALQVSSRIHAFSFGRGDKGSHPAGARLLVGQFALLAVCLCPLCGAATGLVCLANRLMQAG